MKWLVRFLLALSLVAAFLYIGDYLSVRHRFPNNRKQFDSVDVAQYYAVPQKNGRVEFLFDRTEAETCTESFFPQLGNRPCWYVRKHKQKRVDL